MPAKCCHPPLKNKSHKYVGITILPPWISRSSHRGKSVKQRIKSMQNFSVMHWVCSFLSKTSQSTNNAAFQPDDFSIEYRIVAAPGTLAFSAGSNGAAREVGDTSGFAKIEEWEQAPSSENCVYPVVWYSGTTKRQTPSERYRTREGIMFRIISRFFTEKKRTLFSRFRAIFFWGGT